MGKNFEIVFPHEQIVALGSCTLLVLRTGMILFAIAFSSETQLGDTEEWNPGLHCFSELELPSPAS